MMKMVKRAKPTAVMALTRHFWNTIPNTKGRVRLSGVTGWADAADVTIYPIEQVPNVSSFTVKTTLCSIAEILTRNYL